MGRERVDRGKGIRGRPSVAHIQELAVHRKRGNSGNVENLNRQTSRTKWVTETVGIARAYQNINVTKGSQVGRGRECEGSGGNIEETKKDGRTGTRYYST